MEILICILQGVVQGLTEFLPVSSSGHLALLEQAFGVEPRLYLASALHLGTLAAVVVHYWESIQEAVRDTVSFVFHVLARGGTLKDEWNKREGARMGTFVLVSCLPTAAVGLGVARFWKQVAGSLLLVSLGLMFTAAILLSMRFLTKDGPGGLTWKKAFWVGLAQGVAAFPGISRSGSTIAMALFLGVKREEAAKFSFLISIPAILGASLLEWESLAHVEGAQVPGVLLGTLTAGGVGYVALRLLLRWLDRGRLHLFYLYLIPLGMAGFVWSLFREFS